MSFPPTRDGYLKRRQVNILEPGLASRLYLVDYIGEGNKGSQSIPSLVLLLGPDLLSEPLLLLSLSSEKVDSPFSKYYSFV